MDGCSCGAGPGIDEVCCAEGKEMAGPEARVGVGANGATSRIRLLLRRAAGPGAPTDSPIDAMTMETTTATDNRGQVRVATRRGCR